jgi:hypothetical protein
MTGIPLIGQNLLALGAQTVAWLATGVLAGALYFLALRRSIRLLVDGQLLLPIGLQLTRFAALAAVLAMLAHWFGALPLLLVTLGLLIARTAALRWGPQP